MSKVILSGFILAPADDLDLIVNALPKHIELTRNEPGCIVFDVKQCTENKFKFVVYEEFDTKASFEKHQERVLRSTWGEATKNIQRNYNITSL